jgi:uracil phosphoribosyltransferase
MKTTPASSKAPFVRSELEHKYGNNVHILQDPCMSSWLARLCGPSTFQPQINTLVQYLYTSLLQNVMNAEFPTERCTLATRMTAAHPEAPLQTEMFLQTQRVVTVNLARAGTFPSHICFDLLNNIMNPQLMRQDHILASRMTDDHDKVTGTAMGGAKIGGDVDGAIVLFPDPMGATGNTLISMVDHYKKVVSKNGQAAKYIALHLIVTPEYLKNVQEKHPDLLVYAVRVDRGLSTEKALTSAPGTFWDEERGLNEKHYIVPGGGGFGEIMNNSFV